MEIKVLGTGCAKCKTLEEKIRKVVMENKIDATISKVSYLPEIMKYGIMMTPGIVIDEKVVHYGSVPNEKDILRMINEA